MEFNNSYFLILFFYSTLPYQKINIKDVFHQNKNIKLTDTLTAIKKCPLVLIKLQDKYTLLSCICQHNVNIIK
jgi:hypothetical protein